MSREPEKIRVLIADDSFFIRRYLSELFKSKDDIEVVGSASDGEEVVLLARQLRPDVITMDYHMPKKNGMEAAAEIMLGERPLPAIIMLSAFDGQDGERVKRSLLSSGAEVLTKPSGEISLDIERSAQDIVTKVRQIGRIELKMKRLYNEMHKASLLPQAPHASSPRTTKETPVIVFGASTGGPPLIERLLSVLDPRSGISVFIVQHMSRYFTELFAERLDRVTDFSVREARSGELPKEGEAFVVPGGMYLERAYADEGEPLDTLLVRPIEEKHETEIDRTMRAIAELYGRRTVGVLLSGMGADGAIGMAEIKRYGGTTIVQHPDDAAVASMPKSALSSADIDHVLFADEIANVISTIAAS